MNIFIIIYVKPHVRIWSRNFNYDIKNKIYYKKSIENIFVFFIHINNIFNIQTKHYKRDYKRNIAYCTIYIYQLYVIKCYIL